MLLIASGIFPLRAATLEISFTNQHPIVFPDNGQADVYPSTISVSAPEGYRIADLTLTLSNVSHTFPSDMDILLVAPNGRAALVISDVGGSSIVTHQTYRLIDSALISPSSTYWESGTYKPTNINARPGDDVFPLPAPSGPYPAELLTFRAIDPNGEWQLFAVDDAEEDQGRINNGWALTLWLTDDPESLSPVILTQPVSRSLVAGTNVTFNVHVNSGSIPTYQWYQNNNPLPGLTNSSFIITNLPFSAAGNYHAVVTDEFGSAVSSTAILSVGFAPEIVLYPAQRYRVAEGANLALQMSATGTEPLNYEWYRNGIMLEGQHSPTLPLEAVEPDHAGVYFGVVSSPFGRLRTELTQIVVGLAVIQAPERAYQESVFLGYRVVAEVKLGEHLEIQASTNLVTWMGLTNFVAQNRTIEFVDTEAKESTGRFYRILRRTESE